MGGNALTSGSVRLPSHLYYALENSTIELLRVAFPSIRISSIPSYRNKSDFGDMDLLVCGDNYNPEEFARVLNAAEVVRNGSVTSVGIKYEIGVFQVDLIKVNYTHFDFALGYFSYNDMGNLLGRIAHKFGLKFGHKGLVYPVRDGDNNNIMLGEVIVTEDFLTALEVLGYDSAVYCANKNYGFNSVEDIFHYVVSSPYVNKEIYLLENRNYRARTRDRKRATYNAFLNWLECQNNLPSYNWPSDKKEKIVFKTNFIEKLCNQFPLFKKDLNDLKSKHDVVKLVKSKFNANLVISVTGLSGKELGQFISSYRNSFDSINTFNNHVLSSSKEELIQSIKKFYKDTHG